MFSSAVPDRSRLASGASGGKPNTALHIAALAFVAALACWPVLFYGLPNLGNDSIVHAIRTKSFNGQLWSGDWYPRWLMNTNGGLGSPVLYFYGPVPYFASALFWPLVRAADPDGWFAMGYGCVLSVWLSGIAAYLWCRRMASSRAALFAGIIYTVLPYHLAVNVYTRGAVSELWANVWPPLILLAVDRMAHGAKWAFLGLSLSYALLVLTHLPTTLCFSLVPLAASVFLAEPGRKGWMLLRTGSAMTLGAGVTAIYLVPAMLDKGKAYLDTVPVGYFDYHFWWLTQIQPLLESRTRLLLMTLATLGYALAIFLLCRRFASTARIRRLAVFYLSVALAALFMSTQLSAPLWSVLKPLRALPFPTRFLQAFVVAIPPLSALAFEHLRARRARMLGAFAACCVVSWLVADVWAGSMAFSRWRPISPQRATLLRNCMGYQRDDPVYWPRWTRALQVGQSPEFEAYVAANPPRSITIVGTASGAPVGVSSIEAWRPRTVTLKVDTPEPARLTLRHFYYPGWVGRTEAFHAPIQVTPSKPDGFMQMDIPEGRYRLVLELRRELPERAGILISALSLLTVAGLAVWTARRQPTPVPVATPALH